MGLFGRKMFLDDLARCIRLADEAKDLEYLKCEILTARRHNRDVGEWTLQRAATCGDPRQYSLTYHNKTPPVPRYSSSCTIMGPARLYDGPGGGGRGDGGGGIGFGGGGFGGGGCGGGGCGM